MHELTAQLEHYLKVLRLPGILLHYRDLSGQATQKKLHYDEYLTLVLETEVNRKQEASVKTKVTTARFPYVKTIEQFDFSFQPSLNDREIAQLGSLAFIEAKGNVIFLGPPGVGKTHLAVGLGVKACMAGYRVLFLTVQKLLEELTIAKREGNLMGKILAYGRLHMLIIDEMGYTPINRDQANLLFQLISMRYEKGSVILTSNYNFDEWGKIFEDTVAAAAIIDRLVHHANIFYVNGSSYRLKDKLKKDKTNA
jgi:DNA replication protein DnaC